MILSIPHTAHPIGFQPKWVRSSSGCYPTFILAMRRSRGFASTAPNLTPVRTRFRYGSGPQALNLAGDDKSPDHYAKGTPSGIPLTGHSPPTACRHVVSGSVSSPCRGSSHRSLALLFAIGHQGVLSLAGWSPRIRTHFHVLSRTQDTARPLLLSPTGLSPSAADHSRSFC
jgi:hypothetical protein